MVIFFHSWRFFRSVSADSLDDGLVFQQLRTPLFCHLSCPSFLTSRSLGSQGLVSPPLHLDLPDFKHQLQGTPKKRSLI